MRIMLRTALCAVLLLGTPALAAAQAPPPPPVQEASAQFAYVGTTGNTDTQTIGLGAEVIERRPTDWVLTVKADYVRNKSLDVVKAQSGQFLGQAARALTPTISAFGRYTFLHDAFAGINNRNTVEGGISDLLLNVAEQTLTIDAALGYAHEERTNGIDLSNGTLGLGELYLLKLSPTADVSDDGRLLFSLSTGDDWRFTNIAAVSAKLTTLLSLKLTNTIRFVNAPVPTFRKTDTIMSIALVLKF